ncbi:hypothetical protein CR969_02720 [Candidatus Saccharibacteria bacterium]|nr:MAG: hypothetical protein CR969_02720 [Candidatus Saccharibacteria bacterium]
MIIKVRINNVAKIAVFGLLLSLVIFGLGANTASAATPPDACFSFNANTGTIIDYYDNENNNPSTPACTRDVDIPATIGGSPVVAIGGYSFSSKSLTGLTIPGSVTSIGSSAFRANLLTSVVIPGSVTTIGDQAFGRNRLTSVNIPNSVTTLGHIAFGSNELTSVTISNSLTSIAHNTFAGNRLTTVNIPDSVTSIDPSAFTANSQSVSVYDTPLEGGSAVTVSDYIDSFNYVRIYTNTPTNPNGLSDGLFTEANVGGDVNLDGDMNDSLGGYLINPAHATLNYRDVNGSDIHAPQIQTGAGLSNYLVSGNPGNDLSLYYRLGQTQTFTPLAINGYVTPSALSMTLVNINNQHNFTYLSTTAGAGSNGANDNNSADNPASVPGMLAETGSNQMLLIAFAVVVTAISASFVFISTPRLS